MRKAGGDVITIKPDEVRHLRWVHTQMIQRCTNPHNKDWLRYGGRGIGVAREWTGRGGFAAWLQHIGARPFPEAELDRIDTNKGYMPGNVRWVDQRTQDLNRRRSPRQLPEQDEHAIVTAVQLGVSRAALARHFGVHPQTVTAILNRHAR